jgi:N-acetylglucosamine-6-sulfatase
VLDGYYSVTVTLSRVFRRASLVVGIVLAVAFLPVVAEGKGKARAATGKPNILLLLFDDMRYEGVIDNPAVLPKTKRWLADGGVNFTQAFTTTPLCCPNRATMWSGLLMHNHRVFDNYAGDNLDRDWIAPRYLRDAGYGTALVGKFITDWNWRYEPPHFDNLAVFQGGFTDARFMVRHRGEAKTRTERAPYTTDWIGEKAAAFIDDFETSDDQPWFMQVAPHAPHQEQTAPGPDSCNLQKMYSWPPRYDGAPIPEWKPTPAADIEGGPDHKAEKQDKPAWVRSRNFTHKCAQVTYEGAMRTLMPADDMVDLIMTRLQERGELANTLVILTTDNGYAWNERGMTSKGAPWIENVQAPFLVRWDGVFPPTNASWAPSISCRPTSTPPATTRRRSGTRSTAAPSCPGARRGPRSTSSPVRCSNPHPRATRDTGASRPGRRCGPRSGPTSRPTTRPTTPTSTGASTTTWSPTPGSSTTSSPTMTRATTPT